MNKKQLNAWYASKMAKMAFVLCNKKAYNTPEDIRVIYLIYQIAQGVVDSDEECVLDLLTRQVRLWTPLDIDYIVENYTRVMS